MPIVINTNVQALQNANNLSASAVNLTKSLARLSSGSRIVVPSDDAAGLAVSSRLKSQISRLEAALSNVVNAVSFTQTQDGYMKTIDNAFRRMGELAMLALDQTKSASDRQLYNQEFQQLQSYISATGSQKFNDVDLFSATDIPVTIDSSGNTFALAHLDINGTDEYQLATRLSGVDDDETTFKAAFSGGSYLQSFSSITLSGVNYTNVDVSIWAANSTSLSALNNNGFTVVDAVTLSATDSAIPTTSLSSTTDADGEFITHISTTLAAGTALSRVLEAISQIAVDRAKLGALQARLNFTNEQLMVTRENLGSAVSRIADVDVAEEATVFARNQILVQSGTAMLQQANALPQSALRLLGA